MFWCYIINCTYIRFDLRRCNMTAKFQDSGCRRIAEVMASDLEEDVYPCLGFWASNVQWEILRRMTNEAMDSNVFFNTKNHVWYRIFFELFSTRHGNFVLFFWFQLHCLLVCQYEPTGIIRNPRRNRRIFIHKSLLELSTPWSQAFRSPNSQRALAIAERVAWWGEICWDTWSSQTFSPYFRLRNWLRTNWRIVVEFFELRRVSSCQVSRIVEFTSWGHSSGVHVAFF